MTQYGYRSESDNLPPKSCWHRSCRNGGVSEPTHSVKPFYQLRFDVKLQIPASAEVLSQPILVPVADHHRIGGTVFTVVIAIGNDRETYRLVIWQKRRNTIDVELFYTVMSGVPCDCAYEFDRRRTFTFRFLDDEFGADGRSGRMMRRPLHSVDIFEQAKWPLRGKVYTQRADDLAAFRAPRRYNRSRREHPDMIFRSWSANGDLRPRYPTINLVSQSLRCLEHVLTAGQSDIDGGATCVFAQFAAEDGVGIRPVLSNGSQNA